jgi:hypothetical protein
MPTRTTRKPAKKTLKKAATKPIRKVGRKAAKPVTARALLADIAELLEQRGLDHDVILGCLCEVIATHQPTARRAVASIAAILDREGIR